MTDKDNKNLNMCNQMEAIYLMERTGWVTQTTRERDSITYDLDIASHTCLLTPYNDL